MVGKRISTKTKSF